MSENPIFSMFKQVIGSILFWTGVAFSIMFAVYAVFGFGEFVGNLAANMAAGILFGPVALCAGWFVRKKARGENLAARNAKAEQALLGIAMKHSGILSAAELAMEMQIGIDAARAHLDAMTVKGVAIAESDDEGVVIYRFLGLR